MRILNKVYGSIKNNSEQRTHPRIQSARDPTANDITKQSAPRESGSEAQSKSSGFGLDVLNSNPGMPIPQKTNSFST